MLINKNTQSRYFLSSDANADLIHLLLNNTDDHLSWYTRTKDDTIVLLLTFRNCKFNIHLQEWNSFTEIAQRNCLFLFFCVKMTIDLAFKKKKKKKKRKDHRVEADRNLTPPTSLVSFSGVSSLVLTWSVRKLPKRILTTIPFVLLLLLLPYSYHTLSFLQLTRLEIPRALMRGSAWKISLLEI